MERELLAAMYAKAGSLRRLGDALGVSESTARAWCLRSRIPLKAHGYAGLGTRAYEQLDCTAMQNEYVAAGSVRELARRWGVAYNTAYGRLKGAGIAIQAVGYRSPGAGSRKKGADHQNWKGGTFLKGGYVMEYAPAHPSAQKGYVLQHRLVMERVLGRFLETRELVHHKGTRFPMGSKEDKQDNRPENLEVIARVAHMQLHKSVAPRNDHGRFI